jgi:hypothetical protein
VTLMAEMSDTVVVPTPASESCWPIM